MSRTNPETELRELAQLVVDTVGEEPYRNLDEVKLASKAQEILARPGGAPQMSEPDRPFPRFFEDIDPTSAPSVFVITGPGGSDGRRFYIDNDEFGGSSWPLREMLRYQYAREISIEQAAELGVPVGKPLPWMT